MSRDEQYPDATVPGMLQYPTSGPAQLGYSARATVPRLLQYLWPTTVQLGPLKAVMSHTPTP